MRRRSTIITLVLALGCSCAVVAQTTGGIEGTITDSSGSGMPGVTVEATSPSLQGTRTATSDPKGFYRIPATPPGEYVVAASLPGFRPVQRTATVRLDAIVTASFVLEPAASEQVVVSGKAPIIDGTSTTTGTSYTSEVINHLPVGRNYADIMRANPGVTNDINANLQDSRFLTLSVYGATSAENQWIIDGVNTTQGLQGNQGKAINNEFVQEIAVMTGGYSAEYGRAMGGYINAITKSGGNDFHGDGFAYFDSQGTTAEKQFQPEDTNLPTLRTVDGHNWDYGVTLGGFLLKDQLWFFGAYNRISSHSENSLLQPTPYVSAQDRFPLDTASNYYSGKLTWNVAPGTSVVGTVFADPSTRSGLSGVDPPVNTDPSTWFAARDFGGTDYGIRLTQMFGFSTLATLQGSYHKDQSALNPPQGIRYNDNTCAGGTPLDACTPPPVPNNITGGYGFVPPWANFASNRKQIASSILWSSGSHELRAGGDYMNGRTEAKQFRTGGQQVFIGNEYGQLYYQHRYYATSPTSPTPLPSANSHAQVLDYSAYLEDSWRPLANLTVNVGLRWDGEDTRNYAGASVLRFDTWQPRIGMAWDPWRDGATKVYASVGRFSYAVPVNTALSAFGSWPYNITSYNFDPVSVVQDPNVIGHKKARIGGPSAGPFGEPVDAGIQGPYQDELTIGVERLLLPTLQVGIKGTYRKASHLIEDRCDFDYSNPEIQGIRCVIINPGSNGRFASGDAPACNGLDDPYYECFPTGPATPAAKRIYRGLELSARESVGNKAWLQASYIYSSLRGTEGAPAGLSFDFDYPQMWHNAYGALDLDRTNSFRLDGFWITPWLLAVGLQAYAETGAPLSKLGYFDGGHGATIFLTPRGSEGRLPTLWGANLTMSYPIAVGPVTVTLQGYLYNVFNKQIAISKDQQWTLSAPDGYPDTIYDPNQKQNNPDYGAVLARSDPRLFRAAVRVSF